MVLDEGTVSDGISKISTYPALYAIPIQKSLEGAQWEKHLMFFSVNISSLMLYTDY